jgi:ubiquinone biosynthesis accessory factor UbiJ
MDTMLLTAALAGAEKLINKALVYDPGTRIGLQKLQGQILAVHITTPNVQFFVTPDDEGLRLMAQWEGDVDTRISGSLLALTKIASQDIHNLKDSGVNVMGKTSLLADLQQLLKNVDIDWEEILTQFLGDIVGHQAAQLIRGKLDWASARANSGQRLTREFLTEELKTIPGKNELNDFYHQVDDLRLAVDRAAARAEKILKEKKL